MTYTISSILSLISHIHSEAAEFLEKRLSEKGLESLASSHGFILFVLSQKKSMLMGELSETINRDKSTTTALVKKLEKLGFVKTQKSEDDSRKKIIKLTKKGSEYNKTTSELSDELLKKAFENFCDEDKKLLFSLLCKLSENLSSRNRNPKV